MPVVSGILKVRRFFFSDVYTTSTWKTPNIEGSFDRKVMGDQGVGAGGGGSESLRKKFCARKIEHAKPLHDHP